MRIANMIALALVIIGGLNWLLIGLFEFDLVAAIFGGTVGEKSGLSRIVYILVGIAALWALNLFRERGVTGDTRTSLDRR